MSTLYIVGTDRPSLKQQMKERDRAHEKQRAAIVAAVEKRTQDRDYINFVNRCIPMAVEMANTETSRKHFPTEQEKSRRWDHCFHAAMDKLTLARGTRRQAHQA